MSDPSIARLSVRDNIKRRIRILRQNNQLLKEPNDPKFPSVPLQLTKTIREETFLRCDPGPGMTNLASQLNQFNISILFSRYR